MNQQSATRDPIRLLIVAPSLDILGGQAIQADRLFRMFSKEPRLRVGFLPHNPRPPRLLRWLKSVKYLRTVVTSVIYLTSLILTVRRYDVVHIFSASYYSFLLAAAPALLIARLCGKRSVLNYRSGEAADHVRKSRLTALPLMRLADVIVAPSQYLVDVFRQFGLQPIPIPNPIDTEVFRFRERRPIRPVFLSSRNLEPLYNVACILRGFRIIQKEYPNAELIVAGDGKQRRQLKRLASILKLRNTTFIGRVQPNEMNEVYSRADIYLNSSNIDNMPGSILEAFACGLPVVTTNAGGIPYIVTHEQTGLMVGCDDPEALAGGALRFLRDEAFARMVARNAWNECQKYQWTQIREKWIQLYSSLQSPNRAVPAASPNASMMERSVKAPGGFHSLAPRSEPVKPLKVVVIAPSMSIVGGHSIQARYLCGWMRDAPNLDVSLLPINPALPGWFASLQRVKYLRTILTTTTYCWTLARSLPKCDIVHVFSASYFSFLLSPTPAILIGRILGKRILLNYHSGEAEDHLNSWKRTAAPIIRFAHELVVPSAYLVEVFSRFGMQARAIPNTVDTELFQFRHRLELRPIFLSNRNLEKLYNVGCILYAFRIIQQRHPNARLIVAGDGSERRKLEALAAQLGLVNVEFVGRVQPGRMKELYDEADIYLNSSNIDNMPGSILEAFSAGLPVVTTNAGGIPYIVEHETTGLLVKRGDAEALAQSAMRLLEDQKLSARLIHNARKGCTKYEWSVVRQNWIDLYAELAGIQGLGREGRSKGCTAKDSAQDLNIVV